MVSNTDAIKTLQEASARHDQLLVSLQSQAKDQKKWNVTTQQTLQDLVRQLIVLSTQLGAPTTTSCDDEGSREIMVPRGKAKMKVESDDVFPFSPKPVQVELPIFNGKDLEEWLASANDFFEFYGTEDHHRVTMASFRMEDNHTTSHNLMQPRRISTAEAQARREKGLCYYCDAKFVLGHKCKDPQLFFLDDELEDEHQETVRGIRANKGDELDDSDDVVREQSLVSFNALAGCFTPNTIRVTGEIRGRPVRILIDGGSTHNFVQSRVAKHLGLKVTAAPNFRVLVGNGEKLQNEGCVHDLKLRVQGTELIIDFYVLPLEGTEMVLGVAWMATLGPVTMDFSTLRFQFHQGNKEHYWQGETELVPQLIQLQSLRRLKDTKGVASYYCLQMDMKLTMESKVEPEDMTKLLAEFDMKDEVERQVLDMLEHQLIRKNNSPFSSPVLLVKKKDGTWRFCVDYRALNAITIKDKFPIPTVDELFDELGDSQFFSKLDLLASYHQIRVKAEDVPKIAFQTHEGYYEFLVIPFGLTNAPSTFQATMTDLFRPFLRKFVLIFLDDILVYSRNWQEHLDHVRQVLQRLQENGFVAKRSKCTLRQTTVEYLGHIVSREGLAVDPAKVEAIRGWPVPTTVKEVQAFLGIASYYRKFIKGFATIAAPISDLLRKGQSFEWTEAAQSAMNHLKSRLCSAPILGLPDFDKEFQVETDASGIGIGAILIQEGKPLAYFSQKLSPRMQSASTYNREMFAITQAVGNWRQYLVGRKFIIITDQRSLRELNQQTIQTPEQQRWLSKLIGYDFEIH
ncbi:uncharacterized protein LOC120187712 [Hibiscus syriacus]|uniref:uncharacterized protein LOC120187712 n=1 Tax=Hibiscus syriacus TaxID=106335 RepID=UPI001922352D|nr:uncharacterized protein LOC120187712 [Hibiscus syriacus]